ncbi:MAG: hypothetical protein KGI50_03590 [Patescibacteria group bacterium]|nr:hypothetical protein [Patescibacteria group bacterium]MDE2438375.1 hypothetical protein [Patescibacteria group bacterium]
MKESRSADDESGCRERVEFEGEWEEFLEVNRSAETLLREKRRYEMERVEKLKELRTADEAALDPKLQACAKKLHDLKWKMLLSEPFPEEVERFRATIVELTEDSESLDITIRQRNEMLARRESLIKVLQEICDHRWIVGYGLEYYFVDGHGDAYLGERSCALCGYHEQTDRSRPGKQGYRVLLAHYDLFTYRVQPHEIGDVWKENEPRLLKPLCEEDFKHFVVWRPISEIQEFFKQR